MRVLHWITPLLSLVITCAIASSVEAQLPTDVYPGDSYWAQPGSMTNNPNVFVPPGTQGNFQPYPGIDQFQWGWQQTRNENGIWIQDQRRQSREYIWGAEFLRVWFDRPGKRVFGDGDYDRPRSPIQFEIPRIPGDLPTAGLSNPYFQEFAPRSLANMFKDGPESTGLRLFWGWENEDDSAVTFNAWWTEKGQDYFLRGADPLPDPIRDPIANVLFAEDTVLGPDDLLFPYTLQSFNGGVAVDNGAGDPLLIPFDRKYEMNYSVQAWGAGVSVLRAPIRQGSWYKLRPIVGLRYINLKEHLAFSGLDSGAEYEITSFEDGDVVGEREFLRDILVGIVGGGGVAPGRPEIGTFGTDPTGTISGIGLPTNPYEASLSAKNQAHIAGPEVGLRLDAGGESAKVWASVVGGVAMNNESQSLRGFGFFNHFIDSNFNGITDGEEFVADSVFEDNNTTTHVSPIFEATAALELDVLRFIPILNRNDVFASHSMFRVSYSYLYVGEVTRPAESIDFTVFPANPSLRSDRRGWDMQTLSLSAEFDY